MDFPVFHLDFLGNRMLIAIIAIIHVLINHAVAVGFIPLVTILEYIGYKRNTLGLTYHQKWDNLAYKLMFTAFVITTSLGAMTGVGIWFSASLVNPASIGSLIRVFFGAWFTEWFVFVVEVILIMIFFLTWKRANQTPKAKKNHIIFGISLSIFSWLTMAIIVGILGFMMDPGSWDEKKTMMSGFLNPVYFPQLLFRTTVAMMMGGTFALFLANFFLKNENEIKAKAIRFISLWILLWTTPAFVGAYLYYYEIPGFMIGNLPVAVSTQAFQEWYDFLLKVIIFSIVIALLVSISGLFTPKKLPRGLLIIPLIVMFLFMGTFERIREFIRKPYVIGDYMYANAILEDDYILYKKNGILPYATYVSNSSVGEKNKISAGRDVFRISCTRCHTTHGINSIVDNFELMYGKDKPFSIPALETYIRNMHNVRTYMPPFPGNDAELHALALYIKEIQDFPQHLEGAQIQGTPVVDYKESLIKTDSVINN